MEPHGLISSILPLHILGGALAFVFGYVALSATKGARLHRRSGTLFVHAMVMMSLSGAIIATLNGSRISIVAGLLTFYFVTTALVTVRRREPGWIDRAAMLFALTVGSLAFETGFEIMKSGRPEVIPVFIFGVVGLLAALGDWRMIRGGGIQGRRRIRRHLWRMCFAMWVAAASFFWGPQGRVPEVIRIPPLLAVAVLLPVAVMVLWLVRLRGTRALPSAATAPYQSSQANAKGHAS